jgi:hypothetical protein
MTRLPMPMAVLVRGEEVLIDAIACEEDSSCP